MGQHEILQRNRECRVKWEGGFRETLRNIERLGRKSASKTAAVKSKTSKVWKQSLKKRVF